MLPGEWPPADQELWRRATQKAQLFDRDGCAAHWSATSKINAEKAYGLRLAVLYCLVTGLVILIMRIVEGRTRIAGTLAVGAQ